MAADAPVTFRDLACSSITRADMVGSLVTSLAAWVAFSNGKSARTVARAGRPSQVASKRSPGGRPYGSGSTRWRCGRARDQYAALLPICERFLGPDHPETLANRGNLASWTVE